MTTRVLLLRHGLSSFNARRLVQGRDDTSTLTPEGEAMALRTGEALKDLPLHRAYTSPLRRARRTAELVLTVLPSPPSLAVTEQLLEIDLEPWCGLHSTELVRRFPEEQALWRHRPEQLMLRRADGSNYRPIVELHAQATDFWRHLQRENQDGNVLVVAHNCILRCLLLAALGLGPEHFKLLRLDNCSLSVLNLGDPQVDAAGCRPLQLESINSTLHLGGAMARPVGCQRVLLLRHGETDWNRDGRFQGQIDIPLNGRGRGQSTATAELLRETRIDRAYTSALARPRQTAEAVLKHHPGVPLATVRGLIEIGHGDWEGCLESDIAASWPELLARWRSQPHTVAMPGEGGETVQQVWDRSVKALGSIAAGLAPGEAALVVAHDAVNKTILCDLLGLTAADIWVVKQGNGGVTVIDYPEGVEGQPVIRCLNLTAHQGGVLDGTAAGAL